MRLAKALIRLCVCAGWSEPLLVAELPHPWKSNVAAQKKQSLILSPSVMTCHLLLMSTFVLV